MGFHGYSRNNFVHLGLLTVSHCQRGSMGQVQVRTSRSISWIFSAGTSDSAPLSSSTQAEPTPRATHPTLLELLNPAVGVHGVHAIRI